MTSPVGRTLSLLVRSSLDWIFPRTCRVCGCALGVGEKLLCLGCMADLPRTGLHLIAFNTVHQRIGNVCAVDVAAGWYYYDRESPYAKLIREAKYDDRPATARTLGSMYGRELADAGFAGHFDVLLPVPLHRDKLLKRGYNQSHEIALGIASELGCDVGDNLFAVRNHRSQTRHSGTERYANVQNSFKVKNADELDGLKIAIVDDIITTGSTIHDCLSAVACNSTPQSVSVLSIGVTRKR